MISCVGTTTAFYYRTWALNERYPSEELDRLGRNVSSATWAFMLLKAKMQHQSQSLQLKQKYSDAMARNADTDDKSVG